MHFCKYLIYRVLFDSKIGENTFPLFFLGRKRAGLYFRSVTGPAWAGANGLADKIWMGVGYRRVVLPWLYLSAVPKSVLLEIKKAVCELMGSNKISNTCKKPGQEERRLETLLQGWPDLPDLKRANIQRKGSRGFGSLDGAWCFVWC